MSTKTEHYQLNQYEPGDNFLRTDFNEDNAKIDAALGELAQRPQTVIGSYVGDGEYTRTIQLGFTPKAVILEGNDGLRPQNCYVGGIVLQDKPMQYNVVTIVEGGFTTKNSVSGAEFNRSGRIVFYIAFR